MMEDDRGWVIKKELKRSNTFKLDEDDLLDADGLEIKRSWLALIENIASKYWDDIYNSDVRSLEVIFAATI